MDPNKKITKKFTKKFDSKVISRQYFHRKTGLKIGRGSLFQPKKRDRNSHIELTRYPILLPLRTKQRTKSPVTLSCKEKEMYFRKQDFIEQVLLILKLTIG